jgi:uncharacterized protein YbjT (DUF2867 family)
VRIAVAGGTGVAGRYTMQAAEKAGHEAVGLSRRRGVDLTTGAGLDAALKGVDVIVDAANSPSIKQGKATQFFTQVARRLQESGAEHGASRLVVLSIVGLERVPYGYYQAKLAQEAAALEGPLPVSIVRATQFHEFPGQIVLRTRVGPVALAPRMVIQPIAARTVGKILVEAATAAKVGGTVEVAGPQREYLPDLSQAILHRQGKHVSVLPFSLRGKAREAVQSKALLPTGEVRIAGPTFDEWLEGTDALDIGR